MGQFQGQRLTPGLLEAGWFGVTSLQQHPSSSSSCFAHPALTLVSSLSDLTFPLHTHTHTHTHTYTHTFFLDQGKHLHSSQGTTSPITVLIRSRCP